MLSTLEKELLLGALKRDRKKEPFCVVLGKQLDKDEGNKLLKLMSDANQSWKMSIPLSPQEVSQLLAAADLSSAALNPVLEPDTWSPSGIHQIDYSQWDPQSAKPNVVQGLNKLALCSMFPKNCDLSTIEVHCNKLLLIQEGGYWKPHCFPIVKPGTFGIIILHIPVTGGHRGGCLKFTNPGGKQSFGDGKSCDENFYLTTFLMDSEVELEPVTKGTCAMLFFHLIWKEATAAADSPLDFPVYSSAVSTAQYILSSWTGDSSRSTEKTTETILRTTQKLELSSARFLISNEDLSKNGNCFLSNLELWDKAQKSDLLEDVPKESLNVNHSSNVTHSAIEEFSSPSEDNPQLSEKSLQQVVNDSPDSPEPVISITINSAEPTSHSTSEDDSSQDERESESNLLSRFKESQDEPSISPLLFFPLNGRYSSKKLCFSALRGRDRLVASVFRSIPVVDVDLAQVSIRVSSEKECCTEELVEDCDCPFELKVRLALFAGNDDQLAIRLPDDEGLLLSVRSQLLGKVKDFLFSSGRLFHHRTVLIIWPRRVSISFRCNYIFDHFLDGLEESPTSSQTEPLKTLRQIISFCEQNPFKVWDPSLSAVRSRRLLGLCIHLNAKQEGLTLLRLMGHQVGIGSKNAKVIAKFTTRIAGWKTCADAVLALITVRIRQWGYFISLVRHLKYMKCFEGVFAVAAKLVALLPQVLLSSIEEELTELLLNKFIDLVIDLEMDEKTISTERVNELIRLLPSIGISPLTSLAVHLGDSGWLHSSTSAESCRPFFRALLTEISSKEKDLYDSLVLRKEANFTVKLLDSFHHWKNGSLTDKLLKTICSNHGPLLEQILDCRTILKLEKSSLFWMVSSRLTTLAGDRAAREPEDLVKLFRLGLKLLYEDGPSWLTNSFLSFFTQLESEEQFQLLADTWMVDGCRILGKKTRYPAVFNFFKEICNISVSVTTEPLQLPPQMENQLFECFFNHLDNIDLLASLAEKTSGTWNKTKIEIIHRALCQLGPNGNSSVFAKLTSAAIASLCHHPILIEVTPTPSIDNDPFLKLIEHQLFLTLEFQTVENHQNLVARFGQLFSLLTDGILSRLVLNVYRTHKTRSSTSLRESRSHWNVFRELCRIFSGRDLAKFITKCDDTLELMKGLLWLEDAQVATAYACQLATAFPPPKENNLLWDVLGSVEVRSMTSYNTSARVAYLVLLDERMAQLSAALARLPVITWEDPEASVPGHPEVEEFLRSPAQDKLFYSHPASPDFNTAAFFSLRLKKECDRRGFELYVKTLWISGKVTCQLRKVRSAASSSSSPSPPEEMEEDAVLLNADQMRSELEHLTIARQKFAPRQKSQFFVPDNSKYSAPMDSSVSNSDEMVELVSSPPHTKRIKIDCCRPEIESVGLPSVLD